jgi:hypothetical protein
MTPLFAAANLWEIFLQCDLAGQIITVGLAISSIITWAVMLGKRNDLADLRRLNLAFEQRLRGLPAELWGRVLAYLSYKGGQLNGLGLVSRGLREATLGAMPRVLFQCRGGPQPKGGHVRAQGRPAASHGDGRDGE